MAAVCRLVADRLATKWYDEGDILTRAIAIARYTQLEGALTRAVLFLPQALGPLETELVRALGERGSVRVLLGVTGNAAADHDLVEVARAISPTPIAGVVASRHAGDQDALLARYRRGDRSLEGDHIARCHAEVPDQLVDLSVCLSDERLALVEGKKHRKRLASLHN